MERRSVGSLSTNGMVDDEELGLTFSRRFCLLELNVEKVGENSNCDSSCFSSSKMCSFSSVMPPQLPSMEIHYD